MTPANVVGSTGMRGQVVKNDVTRTRAIRKSTQNVIPAPARCASQVCVSWNGMVLRKTGSGIDRTATPATTVMYQSLRRTPCQKAPKGWVGGERRMDLLAGCGMVSIRLYAAMMATAMLVRFPVSTANDTDIGECFVCTHMTRRRPSKS